MTCISERSTEEMQIRKTEIQKRKLQNNAHRQNKPLKRINHVHGVKRGTDVYWNGAKPGHQNYFGPKMASAYEIGIKQNKVNNILGTLHRTFNCISP